MFLEAINAMFGTTYGTPQTREEAEKRLDTLITRKEKLKREYESTMKNYRRASRWGTSQDNINNYRAEMDRIKTSIDFINEDIQSVHHLIEHML